MKIQVCSGLPLEFPKHGNWLMKIKEVRWKKRTLVVLLVSTLFTFVSCLYQDDANDTTKGASVIENKDKLFDNQVDTSSHLKFTGMVRSILEDSKGNFWFGSNHEGVCRYDGKSFTYFTSEDGLSNNQIRTIQEDQEGNIWFATGYGLSRFDGKEMLPQTANDYLVPSLLSENKWKKEANDLWFNGEREGGVYRYDGQNLSVLKFPILDGDHESFSISGTVTGICEGKNNMIWIANYGGVIGFDGISFKFINKRGLNYHVRSIYEDSKGNLWIGNNGIGVLLYDGNTTINFTEKMGVADENSLRGGTRSPEGTLNHVFAIAEDGYGNIWFGDRDTGAWRYDGETLTNYTLEDGLSSMFVRVIYKDKNNEMWFGMDGGLCKFNGKSFDKMY